MFLTFIPLRVIPTFTTAEHDRKNKQKSNKKHIAISQAEPWIGR